MARGDLRDVVATDTERDVEARLATRAFGLRFCDRDTEADFRAWSLREHVPATRLGMVASLLGWTGAWVALAIGIDGTAGKGAPWVFGVVWPIALTSLALTRWPDRRVLWAGAVANTVAGFVAAGPIALDVIDDPSAISPVLAIIAFFGYTVIRLPPGVAAGCVASYMVFGHLILLDAYRGDEIDGTFYALHAILLWTAYSTGLVVCCVLTQQHREAYRRERIIDEQQRMIAQERERAEALLHNILPDPIAERLKASSEPIADHFDEVSVLFADIVGFTPLASTMDPAALVGLLDQVFSTFDELVARHGVEKIKTIGDAYMAVAGLPEPRADHAEAIADLALDMRAALDELRTATGHDISFRIGLATGPAVAGVIGRSKFAYDLWGHTVNMAARMESHGERGEIQVTEALHDRLAGRYLMEPRGKLRVKGAGSVPTWFLTGKASNGKAKRRRPKARAAASSG